MMDSQAIAEKIKFSRDDISYLLSAEAVREKAHKMLDLALEGKTNFSVHKEKIEPLADFVLQVTKENYPELDIPFHSRWGHFNVAEKNRVAILNEKLEGLDPIEKARAKLDLVVVSVLLDAGAGADWAYLEPKGHCKIGRSEGLALASLGMFNDGVFSNNPENPYRVDAEKLKTITVSDLEKGFQVTKENPLVGVEGRVGLLNSLADVLLNKKKVFVDARPGNILDFLISQKEEDEKITAPNILNAVLRGFGNIWPSRISLGGNPLGDVWIYRPFGKIDSTDVLIPLHKLSQWLTYSLIEPIEESGHKVGKVEALTGLAEYRNGGLFIDFGLLELKDHNLLHHEFSPDDEAIIEWRALTVALLDKIAEVVRKKLKLSEIDFPLAKVLEGGTWWAGRRLAFERRDGGNPPLNIKSDGTVF